MERQNDILIDRLEVSYWGITAKSYFSGLKMPMIPIYQNGELPRGDDQIYVGSKGLENLHLVTYNIPERNTKITKLYSTRMVTDQLLSIRLQLEKMGIYILLSDLSTNRNNRRMIHGLVKIPTLLINHNILNNGSSSTQP